MDYIDMPFRWRLRRGARVLATAAVAATITNVALAAATVAGVRSPRMLAFAAWAFGVLNAGIAGETLVELRAALVPRQ